MQTKVERLVDEIRQGTMGHRNTKARIELLSRLVSNDDLLKARNGDFTASEIEEMFGITAYDRQLLFAWYNIDTFKTGFQRPQPVAVTITRERVDPEAFAERVVALAVEKLDTALDSRIRLAIARALHDVANQISDD